MGEALLLHHQVKLKKEFGKMVKGFNGWTNDQKYTILTNLFINSKFFILTKFILY